MSTNQAPEFPDVYAVTLRDKGPLMGSSNGGIFYALASLVLTGGLLPDGTKKRPGVVYGTVNENGHVFHKRTDDIRDLPALMKSKYVRSRIGDTFSECLDDLTAGREVLFVSTPCVIASLKKYLDAKHAPTRRLITCDIICHGAPAVRYWQKYTAEVGTDVDFRCKTSSWDRYSVRIGQTLTPYWENPYMTAFIDNYTLGEACYACRYKGENRASDLTVGDFWGVYDYYPEYAQKDGTGLLIVRNRRDVVDALKPLCSVHPVSYSLALAENSAYFLPAKKPDDLDAVRTMLETRGFAETFPPQPLKTDAVTRYFEACSRHSLKKKHCKPKAVKGKTVGIITDDTYQNYGNRLQNYALRTALSRMGYTCVNLVYERFADVPGFVLTRNAKRAVGSAKYRAVRRAANKSGDRRLALNFGPYGKARLPAFDALVFGSDQIWNAVYHTCSELCFNLGLFGLHESPAPKRISYAASMGYDTVPPVYEQTFREGLAGFEAVGVREASAARELEKLGIPSVVNDDPVLLLGEAEWTRAAEKYASFPVPQKPYVLIYCLNVTPGDDDIPEDARNLDVFVLSGEDRKINHFDFVRLIASAQLIVTDSFHATVFSLIYKKRAVILDREAMNGRMYQLFSRINRPLTFGKPLDFSENPVLPDVSDSLRFLKEHL